MNKLYEIISKEEKKEVSEIILNISVTFEEIDKLKAESLKNIGKDIKMPGFREGKIPNDVLENKIGLDEILNESIDLWLRKNIGEIIKNETPNAISFPKIQIKKAVPNNPIEIELTIPLKPIFDLPNYKSISSKINKKYTTEIKLNEKEITDTILNIKQYIYKLNTKTKTDSTNTDEVNKPEKIPTNLPDLTDEDIQKISPLKTVNEFMENLKKNILSDKKRKNQEKNRVEIMEEILKETNINVPFIMVEGELKQMLKELDADISKMGMKTEDYLKQIDKTKENLMTEWKPMAEKRVKSELIMREITDKEKIEPKKEDVEKESNHIIEHNKEVKKEDVLSYVTWILKKEETLKFLESQK